MPDSPVGQSATSEHYYVDAKGILRGRGGDVGRPATDAERWFQTERDRFGEALESTRADPPLRGQSE